MIAKIIVDIASSAIDKIFDYILTEPLPVGTRVMVPFGGRKIEGYIISITETSEVDETKLKSVISALDPFPVITEEQLRLAEFMKKRFHIGYCDAIRLFLPPELRSGRVSEIFTEIVTLQDEEKAKNFLQTLRKNANKQKEATNYLLLNKSAKRISLNKMFGSVVINKLKSAGIIDITQEKKRRVPYQISEDEKKEITLTPLQENAVKSVMLNPTGFFLLHGITGSGKTEVYMNIISENLRKGKTAIMLVPEISLTPQVLLNFRRRFGDKVAIIHSGLSAGERFDEWQRILFGEAKIVVGARSAIFMPLKNIGVIVIDEEHEQSYNSENHPRPFQGRDINAGYGCRHR